MRQIQIKLGKFGFGYLRSDLANIKVHKFRYRTHILVWLGRWGLGFTRRMDESEHNMYGGGDAFCDGNG